MDKVNFLVLSGFGTQHYHSNVSLIDLRINVNTIQEKVVLTNGFS